jgi:hypothetical protein
MQLVQDLAVDLMRFQHTKQSCDFNHTNRAMQRGHMGSPSINKYGRGGKPLSVRPSLQRCLSSAFTTEYLAVLLETKTPIQSPFVNPFGSSGPRKSCVCVHACVAACACACACAYTCICI